MNNNTSIVVDDISRIEEKYGCKYVFDYPIKHPINGSWTDQPAAIFYQPNPKPEHSHYMGVMQDYMSNRYVLVDGQSSVEDPIIGIEVSTSELLISRYRHDCRFSEDTNWYVDGGADYFRTNAPKEMWRNIQIQDGEIVVSPYIQD
jgi:hypothetical protein